jgi:hypothetical protein
MNVWLTIPALWAITAGQPVIKPAAPKLTRNVATVHPMANGSFTVSVSPATVSFTATNPNSAPVVAGNATATASWNNLDFNTGPWNLTVQAGAGSFGNCPTVPISAVTVSCASVSATIGGSGSCAAGFKLSTSPQIVASGNQALLTYSYTITLNFTLADSSPSCSLSLAYTATVP